MRNLVLTSPCENVLGSKAKDQQCRCYSARLLLQELVQCLVNQGETSIDLHTCVGCWDLFLFPQLSYSQLDFAVAVG